MSRHLTPRIALYNIYEHSLVSWSNLLPFSLYLFFFDGQVMSPHHNFQAPKSTASSWTLLLLFTLERNVYDLKHWISSQPDKRGLSMYHSQSRSQRHNGVQESEFEDVGKVPTPSSLHSLSHLSLCTQVPPDRNWGWGRRGRGGWGGKQPRRWGERGRSRSAWRQPRRSFGRWRLQQILQWVIVRLKPWGLNIVQQKI